MGISCACEFDDPDWYYEVHDQPCVLDTKRFRKCVSCRAKIVIGGTAHKVHRWRSPRDEVEERIFGEGGEVYMADWYLCLTCAAIYHALEKVNACVNLGEDNLHDCLKEFNAEGSCRGAHPRRRSPAPTAVASALQILAPTLTAGQAMTT